MKTRHESVGPDGQLAKRSSSTKVYAHAVWVRKTSPPNPWFVEGWCSRLDLANKLAHGLRNMGYEAYISNAIVL